jgi:hypothetical protein
VITRTSPACIEGGWEKGYAYRDSADFYPIVTLKHAFDSKTYIMLLAAPFIVDMMLH